MKRIRSDDREPKIFRPGASVLIAVSGGPDSVALFHIFLSLREKLGLRLGVAHMNYRLRGEDSEADERLVRSYCRTHGIPCFVSHPHRSKNPSEEELRDLRYRFFERIATREGFDAVVTAHTLDDQAETLLIRLLRGTGPEGLTGIPKRRDRIVRPLLDVTKEELLTLLREESLPFRNDKSNFDTTILRNRIRHELLPLLERDYRPGTKKALARTAAFLAEREHLPFPRIGTAGTSDTEIRFSRADFLALDGPARNAFLRHTFRKLAESGKSPSAAIVREATKLLESPKNKAQTMTFGRLKIEARGDKVGILRTKS